jgi:hypothetical protein
MIDAWGRWIMSTGVDRGSASSRPDGSLNQPTKIFPTDPFGWIALVAAAIGFGSWLVLPVFTMFRDQWPVTDTALMPIIAVGLVLIAAIVNVLAVWIGKQRSVMNVLAMGLTVMATLGFGFIVIGEALGGA